MPRNANSGIGGRDIEAKVLSAHPYFHSGPLSSTTQFIVFSGEGDELFYKYTLNRPSSPKDVLGRFDPHLFPIAMDKYENAAVSSVFGLLFCFEKWTHGGHAMGTRQNP